MPAFILLIAVAPLDILTTRLPDAVAGHGYAARLEAAGAMGALSWTARLPLPLGLRLDRASGEITGMVERTGAYRLVITLNDEDGRHVEREITLRVVPRLVMLTESLAPMAPGLPYYQMLQARGGTPPYVWSIAEGTLPPGIRLDPRGLLRGLAREAGELAVLLAVTDSGEPPQVFSRGYGVTSPTPLEVRWIRPPVQRDGGIFGSVVAVNRTRDLFDLTLVVVAVNEYNKAFTLGYQRFHVAPGMNSPEMPFGFTLPRGRYTAHVDAVAEVPPRTIYRARRQLEGLSVP
jgi:hypothetical protein